jgi:hypothetical protein
VRVKDDDSRDLAPISPIHGVGSLSDSVDVAGVARRLDRFETVATQALKDILAKITHVADMQADLRAEVDQLGRDLIRTGAAVAAVDATAMKRRKPGRK